VNRHSTPSNDVVADGDIVHIRFNA